MQSSDHESSAAGPTFPDLGQRVGQWKLRTRVLSFAKRPLLMGILNVTPDSFSDGGAFFDTRRAVARGLTLVEQGADLLDIGGESTRPYATPVTADEELRRVIPVVAALRERTDAPLSIDTSKAAVAREALSAGAEIVNDVTGLAGDIAMIPLALEARPAVCVMHMQGTPQTMQDNPSYEDVVEDILRFLEERRRQLVAVGFDPAQICLDPGIGFGKTHQHNLTLLANCWRFHALGGPVLIGHSRKGFIAKVLGDRDADRTAGTIGVALALARQGVQILRIHDIGPIRQALILYDAAGGIDGQPWDLSRAR